MRRIATLLLALGIAALAAAAVVPVQASAQPREAPESLRRFVRELPQQERRAVVRRLRTMDPERRRQLFLRWQGMSEAERLERRERWRRELHERQAGSPPQALPRELRDEFRGMSPEDQERARELIRRLPPERRARLQRAIRHWDELTPEQRETVLGHVKRLRRFTEEQRERIERNRPAWEDMDGADRARMRRRLERFRSLPPAQQEALVNERFRDRTPEQRARILESLRAR